jgi:hypothetical protein
VRRRERCLGPTGCQQGSTRGGGGIELLRTIWPAPTTPNFLTSKAIARGVEENWRLIAASLADAVFLLAVDIIDLDNGLIVEAIEHGMVVL